MKFEKENIVEVGGLWLSALPEGIFAGLFINAIYRNINSGATTIAGQKGWSPTFQPPPKPPSPSGGGGPSGGGQLGPGTGGNVPIVPPTGVFLANPSSSPPFFVQSRGLPGSPIVAGPFQDYNSAFKFAQTNVNPVNSPLIVVTTTAPSGWS